MSGPEFLLFYVCLMGVGYAVARMVRDRGLGSPYMPDGLVLDAYQSAYLVGGPRAAVDAAMVALLGSKALVWNESEQRPERGPGPCGQAALEQAIHSAVCSGRGGAAEALLMACARPLEHLRGQLLKHRLLLEPAAKKAAVWRGVAVMLVVVAVGALRAIIGYSLGHPIGFLVILMALSLVATVSLQWRSPRSRQGEAMVERLAAHHAALRLTASKRPESLSPQEAVLAAALFGGLGAWQFSTFLAPAYAAPARLGWSPEVGSDFAYQRPGGGSSGGSCGDGGDSGSGDSGSSCGGGCGGGCGG